ncbi:hypothetical protein B0H11DRAFT_2226152 [Mycena galericulata]|nr:hypothetical protein B0H11DRAFT_2226152 [Mycena galericulata]
MSQPRPRSGAGTGAERTARPVSTKDHSLETQYERLGFAGGSVVELGKKSSGSNIKRLSNLSLKPREDAKDDTASHRPTARSSSSKDISLDRERFAVEREKLALQAERIALQREQLAFDRKKLKHERENARLGNLIELMKLKRSVWAKADLQRINDALCDLEKEV